MTTNEELTARIEGQNVGKRFLAAADKMPDLVAVRRRDPDGVWHDTTFTALSDQVARVAGGLRSLGVEAGDRVAIMALNRPEFHVVDLATLMLGATPVSIYNSSAPEQISYMLGDCNAKVAVIEDAFIERFARVTSELTSLTHLAVLDGDLGAGAPDVTVGTYADLLAAPPLDLGVEAQTAMSDDLATIIYTSGTTGNPKGVMLTHRNVCWTLESAAQAMTEQLDDPSLAGYRHLSYLPMAHIFERLIGHYFMAFLGVQVSCLPNTADLAEYLREVKPNVLIGVPRVWEKLHAGVNAVLAADPDKATQFNDGLAAAAPLRAKMRDGTATEEDIATYDFLDQVAFSTVKSLLGLDETRIAISGAAPLRIDVLEWFDALGVPLTEGYGLSETTSVTTWSKDVRFGYVGRALPGVEVVIADDGEILTRGGNVFAGYLNAPDKTADVMTDDWFHTGDIGELDADGFLRIVDRKKELIITAGGKNVSPANLESALKSIPLVSQACAIGDQRPFVSALVVLDPDTATLWAANHGLTGDDASLANLAKNPDVIAEIDAALAEAMSSFNSAEAVKKVKVLGDEWLPDSDVLTPTSKLKRRGIHARFATEIEELYAR